VIEEGSSVSAALMAGVEAVEAANKRLQEEEDGTQEDREARISGARADLHRFRPRFRNIKGERRGALHYSRGTCTVYFSLH
jgi:hypothetical protein